jgi:hypothetical protein
MDLGKFTAPLDAGLLYFYKVLSPAFINNRHPNLSIQAHNPAHAAYH